MSSFEMLVKEWESGPIPQIIVPEKEPAFNYEIHGYHESEVDDFIKNFLDHPYIPDEEKHIFFEEFVVKYLNDEEYANSLYGKYVLFLNKQYYCIVDYIGDSYNIGKPNDSKLLSQIKKDTDQFLIHDKNGNVHSVEHICQCSSKSISTRNDTYNRKYSNLSVDKVMIPKTVLIDTVKMKDFNMMEYDKDIEIHKQYKIACAITHLDYIDPKHILFSDLKIVNNRSHIKESIIDTGAEIYNLNAQYAWDFDKMEFLEKYNQNNKLNDLIGSKLVGNIKCAGNSFIKVLYVYLKKPLYVSVGGLKPVPIYCFLVPLEPNEELYLISLDILDQLTMIKSNFRDGHYILLMNERTEFWN